MFGFVRKKDLQRALDDSLKEYQNSLWEKYVKTEFALRHEVKKLEAWRTAFDTAQVNNEKRLTALENPTRKRKPRTAKARATITPRKPGRPKGTTTKKETK